MDVTGAIEELIEARRLVFSSEFIRALPFDTRSTFLTRYMANELIYLDMINRANTQQTQTAAALLTLAIPNSTFFNPVLVTPTRAQISSSLQDYPGTTSNCAVCQDSISSGGCRIRQCGHVYHRSCIEAWFASSVRCPVCRHDIRILEDVSDNPNPQVSTEARRSRTRTTSIGSMP